MSTAAAKACDGRRFIDISEAQLGALIQRIEDAITFNLELNPDDYRLLIRQCPGDTGHDAGLAQP